MLFSISVNLKPLKLLNKFRTTIFQVAEFISSCYFRYSFQSLYVSLNLPNCRFTELCLSFTLKVMFSLTWILGCGKTNWKETSLNRTKISDIELKYLIHIELKYLIHIAYGKKSYREYSKVQHVDHYYSTLTYAICFSS